MARFWPGGKRRLKCYTRQMSEQTKCEGDTPLSLESQPTYDDWFRQQVEKGLAEARDHPERAISLDEIEALILRARTD